MANNGSEKRHKGWRRERDLADQRAAAKSDSKPASSASEQFVCDQSALATLLLLLWASGQISATAMQKIAYCAMLDGAAHLELANLAKCDAFGQQPGNVARDVNSIFLPSLGVCPAMAVDVPCIDPKTSKATTSEAHFFLPHLMFWSTMKNYAVEAQTLFALSSIPEFWQGVIAAQCPKLVGHPMLRVAEYCRLFIPLFIHGHGAEFVQHDSKMIYSWGALLSASSSQDTNLLAATWPQSCTIDTGRGHMSEGTWWPILTWLSWSFTAIFEGTHPCKDPYGQEFPRGPLFEELAAFPLSETGHRGVVWSLEGDHDYFSNALRLPHWQNAFPCWACSTCTDDPASSWRNLLPGQQGWVAKDAAAAVATLESEHLFFKIAGVSTLMVAQDALHIIFCKGILSRLLGSALHVWCWPTKGRQTVKPSDALGSIFSQVQMRYRELRSPTRLTNLKLSMFTNEKTPHATEAFLKIKGAECKHLLKPICLIASERRDNEFDRRLASCLLAVDRLIDIIDDAGMFLTSAEHSELTVALGHFNGHYAWLNKWAEAQDRLLFNITIKFHMIVHLVASAQFLNPRYFWCFRGEDYVGKVSALAASVSMGVGIIALSQKVVMKYRHWLHLRLTRGDFQD